MEGLEVMRREVRRWGSEGERVGEEMVGGQRVGGQRLVGKRVGEETLRGRRLG